MADVLLREYIDQLRDTIHAGKYSDAFALGQHILHYFPKHIETYTLLAQASLETNDLAGATDLFRRVLSADPENILALAGMALLSETQDKQDDALWYLERAYEMQPSNDDLRRELLRMREQFYGTAPARIELTSGALARVYARQGQYAHAVNELRRLLRNDSQRFDARVALAEALYRAGRTDEAAQVAQNVMADAPYALKPNLIIGVLWSDNAVPEGQEFLRRAQQLDPEHRVARDMIGERFVNGQSPRLPALGEAAPLSEIETKKFETAQDIAALHAIEFLRELERAQEPEEQAQEPLAGELDMMALVEQGSTESPLTIEPEASDESQDKKHEAAIAATAAIVTAAALAEPSESATSEAVEEASPVTDSTLQEIARAEETQAAAKEVTLPPAPAKPQSEFATRIARSKSSEGVNVDAIAAAATALAASIALDKANQPPPARRAHPAIPKVRPVIRGAAEKLPPWLRLGATPSAAPASFDDAPAPDDRPAWLVEAQAVAAQEPIAPQSDADLPDWLTTTSLTTAAVVTKTEQPAPDIPEWLRDAVPSETQTASTVATEASSNAPAQPVESDTFATLQESNINVPDVQATEYTRAETIQEPPSADVSAGTETIPAQAMPDSATMLQMARDERAGGDLKTALELYERVMHRRPNHLDQVTSDLQEIVASGGAPTSANRLLGEAYAMAGRFKESLEQYRIAMGKS